MLRQNTNYLVKSVEDKKTEKSKKALREGIRTRDTLFQAFRCPVKGLSWKLQYVFRESGADSCRTCDCYFSLCDFIWALFTYFKCLMLYSFPLPSSSLLPPLLLNSLNSEERDLMDISHLKLCVLWFLCLMSVVVPIYF